MFLLLECCRLSPRVHMVECMGVDSTVPLWLGRYCFDTCTDKCCCCCCCLFGEEGMSLEAVAEAIQVTQRHLH
jgi:hypothetical protein